MSDIRQRFSIIPAMAVTDPRLEPRDLQVLCLLGRHTNDLGWCCRSQVKMSRELNCGRATVQRALQRLVEAGYLEHRSKQRDSGADAAHDYRVVIDPPQPAARAQKAVEGVPTGGQGCPPMSGQGVPIHERAPMLTTPVKREERGARDGEPEEAEIGEAEPEVIIDMRSLEKRVKRLAALKWQCRERSKWVEKAGWPKWANSSTRWTVQQFARLSEEERQRAETRAPTYLAQCGMGALSLGTYFSDRKFDEIPASALKAIEESEARVVAKPFGKIFGARRMRLLFEAPGPLPRPSGFIEKLIGGGGEAAVRERLRHQAMHGWPEVNRMHEAAHNGSPVTLAREDVPSDAALALMEAVQVGGEAWRAWQDFHEARGWPLPDPGDGRWVWMPKGGPNGLDAFEAAITGEAQGDDGGDRQAAE